MTICCRCLKLIPGKFDATELVMCKECAEWFNPNHIKIKVPKFDAKTLEDVSVKLERKAKHRDDEKQN